MTKACKLFLFVAVAFLLSLAPAALADTATLDLTGAGNNVSNGVYVGPYTATINGVSYQVICDDYSHESYVGETWTANVSSFPSLQNVRFSTSLYDQIAFLASNLFSNASNNQEADAIQFAIWYLTGSPSVQSSLSTLSFFNDSTDVYGVQYWLNLAAGQSTTAPYSNFQIYTPQTSGDPQEFIVETPEPGVIILLVVGLCGLFLLKRRQGLMTAA